MKVKRHLVPVPVRRGGRYRSKGAGISRLEKLIWMICPGLLLLSVGAVLVSRSHSSLVERYYSLGFYQAWAGVISSLTGKLPFSLAELLIIAFALGCAAALGIFIRGLVRGRGERGSLTLRFLLRALSVASVLVLLFTLNGGLNYYRPGFLPYSGLTPRPSRLSELEALCLELGGELNTLRGELSEDEAGVATDGRTPAELAAQANAGYTALVAAQPQWEPLFRLAERVPPKPVRFSEAMSYMQIVGFFFPYTIEANVNVHTTQFDIPNALCHELAHIAGFMREDEANFLSYLSCRAGGDAFFSYSGTMLAFIHSSNALYGYDTRRYQKLMDSLSPAVRRDLAADAAYYAAHDTSFGDFSSAVNDAYLKVNNQQDGVAGYGRMVDLLLADYRARHGVS